MNKNKIMLLKTDIVTVDLTLAIFVRKKNFQNTKLCKLASSYNLSTSGKSPLHSWVIYVTLSQNHQKVARHRFLVKGRFYEEILSFKMIYNSILLDICNTPFTVQGRAEPGLA